LGFVEGLNDKIRVIDDRSRKDDVLIKGLFVGN